MDINNLNFFHKGWFIGDFDPSLSKTKDFEVGVKFYKSGDSEQSHYHKVSTEYTIVTDGVIKMNDRVFVKNDIITIYPNEVVKFDCIEDATTVVIKTPHTPNDKYLI